MPQTRWQATTAMPRRQRYVVVGTGSADSKLRARLSVGTRSARACRIAAFPPTPSHKRTWVLPHTHTGKVGEQGPRAASHVEAARQRGAEPCAALLLLPACAAICPGAKLSDALSPCLLQHSPHSPPSGLRRQAGVPELLSMDLIDDITAMMSSAAWHAAYARLGWGKDKSAAAAKHEFDARHTYIVASGELSTRLCTHLKWMSWNAAWFTANTRAGNLQDAAKDKVGYERQARCIRGDIHRGVSLGGWLLLQRWMCAGAFSGVSERDAHDEFSLCAHLGSELAARRITAWRDSWISRYVPRAWLVCPGVRAGVCACVCLCVSISLVSPPRTRAHMPTSMQTFEHSCAQTRAASYQHT